jgi:hypothetical protein
MLTSSMKFVFSCLLVLSMVSPRLVSGQDSALKPIFNGKDLLGWRTSIPNPFWRVEEGVLIGDNDEKLKGHVLFTEKAYKDFVIEAEVRWSGEIDSGFILRKPELQLQIGVSRSLKKDMTCSFYTGGQEKYPEAGQAKDLAGALKAGEWNRIRLQAKGDTFTAWLNGKKVSEYTNSKFAEAAPVGLQIHPGLKMRVDFRDVRLQELP